jgi:hypothetical protein
LPGDPEMISVGSACRAAGNRSGGLIRSFKPRGSPLNREKTGSMRLDKGDTGGKSTHIDPAGRLFSLQIGLDIVLLGQPHTESVLQGQIPAGH